MAPFGLLAILGHHILHLPVAMFPEVEASCTIWRLQLSAIASSKRLIFIRFPFAVPCTTVCKFLFCFFFAEPGLSKF